MGHPLQIGARISEHTGLKPSEYLWAVVPLLSTFARGVSEKQTSTVFSTLTLRGWAEDNPAIVLHRGFDPSQ
jgi:hypothetical protein